MEYIKAFFEQLTRMQWSDYLDIIAVACLIYFLLPLLRTTGASRIARVVVAVLAVSWIADLLNMHAMSFILNEFL